MEWIEKLGVFSKSFLELQVHTDLVVHTYVCFKFCNYITYLVLTYTNRVYNLFILFVIIKFDQNLPLLMLNASINHVDSKGGGEVKIFEKWSILY